MRKMFLLMVFLLLSSGMAMRADEQVTISATNSDIAAGLDLRVVAKIFAEAKDLEDFEMKLNSPDSAFCNLDLNGDGQVDYIRVVETGEGSRRLIVLQAVLAKDIYQDVASIYVEKDEQTSEVKVEIVGDEMIYGAEYVIVPTYYYRPVIYDWFWGPYWYSWHSPYYWGYWPGYWHPWAPYYDYAYYRRCYNYCGYRPVCSYRSTREVSTRARQALVQAESHRQTGATQFVSQRAARVQERSVAQQKVATPASAAVQDRAAVQQRVAGSRAATAVQRPVTASTASRTFGSSNTAATRAVQKTPVATTTRQAQTTQVAGSTKASQVSRSTQASQAVRSTQTTKVSRPTYSSSSTLSSYTAPTGSESSRSSSSHSFSAPSSGGSRGFSGGGSSNFSGGGSRGGRR